MSRLPRSLEQLAGLRAARWLRESSKGQADRFGPDAQREQQDRAIERYGLVDAGVAWEVAHSGRTIASTAQWAAMLAAAGDRYDVLVVGYVSRFARDLRTAVNARADMHSAGAAILFADERLLSSDDDQWEHWARETVEAEAYSRRLGKRTREGYAARRRRFADPGGRPPFGFRRTGPDHLVEPDPETMPAARRIFELAASRRTDREIVVATGVTIDRIRTLLRSPLYVGRLPDGSSTRFAAPVPLELWSRVQEIRATRRTRDGRPAKREPYALTMLHCAACGRRLIGDQRRYRHVDACPAFTAAAVQPGKPRQGQHARIPGKSYPAASYEAAIAAVLERVELGADVIADVVTGRTPKVDQVAIARIERERDAALARYRRDRDGERLAATMQRLDANEQLARETPAQVMEAGDAVALLRNLPALWAEATDVRRRLAEFLFERVEVLGLRSIDVVPSARALEAGFADAFRTGRGGYGRGGGGSDNANQLIVRLAPRTVTRIRVRLPAAEPLRVVRSA